MENRLRRQLGELARQLVEDEQERLAEAGTLIDLEQLAAEIGDRWEPILAVPAKAPPLWSNFWTSNGLPNGCNA